MFPSVWSGISDQLRAESAIILRRNAHQPEARTAARLRRRFDRIFGQVVAFADLQATLERTLAKKDRLLLVLKHPGLPLHNNEVELAARQRVRRRDISFGPRSRQGARAWDIYQSLAATTRKLGVSYYDYLYDGITAAGRIPRLSGLVAAKAAELGLARTWASPPLLE